MNNVTERCNNNQWGLDKFYFFELVLYFKRSTASHDQATNVNNKLITNHQKSATGLVTNEPMISEPTSTTKISLAFYADLFPLYASCKHFVF